MLITKIKLTGFKRIALTGYRDIEIDFTRKLQLILGMNGSGKSSLMYELSPLPVNNNDLYTGGSKEIWITHQQQEYYLANFKGGKCSFLNLTTNEELNPGGTQTVQKTLIADIFGYTSDVHELLVGSELFTDMRPATRKEWITKLSDVNYDYALKVYALLKERFRDTQGALKIAKKKYTEAIDNQIDTQEEETLRKDIKDLENVLETLNSLRMSDVRNVRKADTDALYQTLREQVNLVVGGNRQFGYLLKVEVDSERVETEARLKTLKEEQVRLLNTLQEQTDKRNAVEKLGSVNVQELETQIKELLEKVRVTEEVRGQVPELDFEDPKAAKRDLQTIGDELIDLVAGLPNNETGYYDKSRLETLSVEVNTLQERVLKGRDALVSVQGKIDHLKEHEHKESVTCPKCTHGFNPYFSKEQLTNLEAKRNQYASLLQGLEQELTTKKEVLQDVLDYHSKFNRFLDITRSNRSLRTLWHWLSEERVVSTAPVSISTYLRKADYALTYDLMLLELREELAKLTALKEQSTQLGTQNLTQLNELIEAEEARLNTVLEAISQAQKRLGELEKMLRYKQELVGNIARLRELDERFKREVNEAMNNLFQEHLMESIRITQVRIGEVANKLSGIDNQKAVIQHLANDIKRLEEEEATYKILMTELSPTDGLIASGLMGFINHLVAQMNKLINSVWSYSLNIVPPSYDETGGTELDYKFPFELSSEEHVVPDISLGSRGQKEIINLAFRIIACKYLHLTDIPIFADEFGTGFDEVHRKRAANAIKTIIAESIYSQLFMISHYEDAHGSLTNAEVCVLSAENITVPKEYNQHVKFG